MSYTSYTVDRTADAEFLNNRPGQDFVLTIGFADEVRISTDARLVTPPITVYPERLRQVPVRPIALMGPNRIAFVDEPLPFYGGRSYRARRIPAYEHTWQVFDGDTEVTSDTDVVTITTELDTYQTYLEAGAGGGPIGGPQPAWAQITFKQTGVYRVALTVYNDDGDVGRSSHTGYRQVIVYTSRDLAPAKVMDISSLAGGRGQGGWGCSLRITGDLSMLLTARQLNGYIPVVIRAETLFESAAYDSELGYYVREWTPQPIGPLWHDGHLEDDPSIIFSGYIDKGTIQIDFDHSEARFDCRTADMILEQMQTHVVGFFESASDGKGVTFNDLTVGDVYRYMLQEKSDFADFHDVRLHYNRGSLPYDEEVHDYFVVANDTVPNMEYRDWTFNNGAYWSNIRDGAENQFEMSYVDNTSALFVVPDRNMWPPQVFVDGNQYNDWNDWSSTYDGFRSTYDLPWAQVPLGPEETPIGTVGDGSEITAEHWSGAPVSVPMRVTVQERLSGLPGYYKLTGNLSFWNEEWGADYPQDATDATEGQWLLAGAWVLVSGKYWSDQNRDRAWRNIFRFAARGYASVRSRYSVEVQYGWHGYWRQTDMVELVYDDPNGRFSFQPHADGEPAQNLFDIESISHAISVEQQTWVTSYQLRELTVYSAPEVTIPPLPEEVEE